MKKKIISAIVNAEAVIAAVTVILIFIMVAIIPKFKKIFDEFNLQLPWMTKTLIQVSDWMAKYWYWIPIFPIAFWLLLKLIRLSKTGNYVLDWLTLLIPIVGGLVKK